MHERSLVQNLIGQVAAILQEQGGDAATEIEVSIGPLSGVEPLLVESAFEQLAPASPLAGAKLIVQHAELTAVCRRCQASFVVESLRFRCAACGSPEIQITGGDEFRLLKVTIEQTCPS